jgi:tetratricopeptide (TPR) repeat protein
VLIAGDGQLAAIYRGPVSVDRLLSDVAKLDLSEEQLRMASLPFPGRWAIGPARISLVPVYFQLLNQGYSDEAQDLLTRNADRFPPEIASATRLMRDGMQLMQQGDVSAATTRFRQATVVEPENAEAYFQLGRAWDQQQRSHEAAEAYRNALQRDPTHAGAHFSLALNRQAVRETAVAMEHLREVLRLRPDHVPSMYHLARILATDPHDEYRDGAQALQLAEKAVAATDGRQAEVLAVLAAAHAEKGDIQHAQKLAEQALQLARSRGNLDVAQQIESQLKSYAEGRPWRETQ